MAAQTNGHLAQPDPMEVGNAFIRQYYPMLISSPDLVHKFYQEGSEISRPGPDGEMTSITTVQGINEKILSLNYDKYKVEIITVDAQASYKGGLSVLVTGVLTGEDGARRMFTLSFFLAPQDRGYYVLNDMFRYVDGKSAAPVSLVTSGDIAKAPEYLQPILNRTFFVFSLTLPPVNNSEFEFAEVSEKPVEENVPVEDVLSNGEGDTSSMENGKASVASYLVRMFVKIVHLWKMGYFIFGKCARGGCTSLHYRMSYFLTHETSVGSPADSSTNDASSPAAVAPPAIHGDGSKKSFASIVNAIRNNSAPFQIRASPVKVMEKPVAPAVEPEAPAQSVPNGNINAEKIGSQAVKRLSIFVSNLPLDATPEQLEADFKRFGRIKHNGIQVRSSKGSCYGFVEFESESSVGAALEEASIPVGNRRAHIEEEKSDGDKGSAPQGWGGFSNNNFRGRGGLSRGRVFDGRFEFSSRNGHSEGGAFNREYHYGLGLEGWE